MYGIANQNEPKRFVTIRLAIGKQVIGYPDPEDLALAVGRKAEADTFPGFCGMKVLSRHPTTAYWRDLMPRTTDTFIQSLCVTYSFQSLGMGGWQLGKGLPLGVAPTAQDLLYTRNPPTLHHEIARESRLTLKERVRLILPRDLTFRIPNEIFHEHFFGMCGECLTTGFYNSCCPFHDDEEVLGTFMLTVGRSDHRCNSNVGIIDTTVLRRLTGKDIYVLGKRRVRTPLQPGMLQPKIDWWHLVSMLPNEGRNKLIVFIVLRTAELNRKFGTTDVLKFNVDYGLDETHFKCPPPFVVR